MCQIHHRPMLNVTNHSSLKMQFYSTSRAIGVHLPALSISESNVKCLSIKRIKIKKITHLLFFISEKKGERKLVITSSRPNECFKKYNPENITNIRRCLSQSGYHFVTICNASPWRQDYDIYQIITYIYTALYIKREQNVYKGIYAIFLNASVV